MAKATWRGAILAEGNETQIVEGNVYFAPACIKWPALRPSDTHTVCPWKGTASYYDVIADGAVNRDAAWTYPEPKPEAKHIAGYVAFWRGVEVEQ